MMRNSVRTFLDPYDGVSSAKLMAEGKSMDNVRTCVVGTLHDVINTAYPQVAVCG